MTTPPDQTVTDFSFDRARVSDLDALVAIDSDSPRPWARGAFEEELRRDGTMFVLRRGGHAVAFAVVRNLDPEMDIVNLAVHPDERRRGLGRILLRSLLENGALSGTKTAFLEVREGNGQALEFYRSLGFQETQRRPAFYADPVEDAILLRLEIEPKPGLKGLRNAC